MQKRSTLGMLLIAFLSIGAGFTVFAYTANRTTTQKNLQNSYPAISLQRNRINDGIFSSSTPLDSSQMSCNLTSATKTDASVTVTARFTIGGYIEWGDRNSSVYLIIDDADWSGDKTDPSISGAVTPSFSGYTSRLDTTSSKFKESYYVIPEEMTYGSTFKIQNKKLVSGLIDFSNTEATVTNIIIPSSVETIEENAFINVPNTVTISCVAQSKPAGWASNWTDASNVTFGFNNSSILTKKNLSVATGINVDEHPIDNSYIVGYINGSDEEYFDSGFVQEKLPLVVTYDVVNGSTKTEVKKELPLMEVGSRNAPYDAVGDIGSANLAINVDIFLNDGESLDFNSFKFYNIYLAKRDATLNSYCCDKTNVYSIEAAKRFSDVITLDDIVNHEFKKVSSFAGYTLVTMNVDKVKPLYYEKAAANIIAENAEKIASGEYKVRYAFYNLSHSKYRITYDDGGAEKTVEVNISTPLPVIELSKDSGNTVSFIIKNSAVGEGFTAYKLRSFKIIDLTINMHLWNNTNNSIVGKTSKLVKFGIVDIMPTTQTSKPVDLNVALILTYVIYAAVYAAGATGLYFFMKNKFKNDEFRRVKPKKFLKSAIIGFFGLGEVLLAVVGLIYRTSLFANTLYAFNPSDVLVVIAGIIALIIIGYFIKFIVTLIKAEKERRENKRLKLND